MAITGIGTVRWKFRTKDSVLAVTSSAYHAPNIRARLISPHRLFIAEKGVLEKNVVEETNETLIFDKVGEIVIDYGSGSNLPTALGKNFIHGQDEANLRGVFDKVDDHLFLSLKLLLRWHCCYIYRFI